MVACLAHAQEVAGSNPAPATRYFSKTVDRRQVDDFNGERLSG